MKLEDLKKGTVVRGVLPGQKVVVVDAKWFGDSAVELFYRADDGRTGSELLYRDREAELEVESAGQQWTFDADGNSLRLVSEAHRIRLAYLFDPYLAVHTSLIQPLPHQITAVYGDMLPRHPLRFLLADDPGAGKTIMAGLLIRELLVRGDLERCLIVCPGSLAEQWQDELYEKFSLHFDLLTRDKVESSPTGNPFIELNHLIARLDHVSRNDELKDKLKQSHWDLVICDEAHKMSASYYGNEVKYTKRYRLGQLLGGLCRHFLLMTATPHNGKEIDFQLFMSLLDGDRFEGKYRDGVHQVDTSDLMRRMIKEKLVKFDGTPLFPERKAYTVSYRLSDAEAALYARVTEYVREEFNRAEALENDGRRGTVGFALTILQRRLASSPEAIYQSLCRRRKRLEKRLQEQELLRRGALVKPQDEENIPDLTLEDLEDLEDAPDAEIEETEERVIDLATAAQTIEELKAEIAILKDLEADAEAVLRSGTDRKWDELSALLQDNPEMFAPGGIRRKLVLFSEHRDTLNYLIRRIGTLTGNPDSIVCIHGGLAREKRREAASRFTQDPDVHILVATDAAGEGINLQRAHLMVNYDLPWNPNRLEQRFGRIHRIGQTEVCHLWNIVAGETREGQVLQRLCEKIEAETEALQGQVFDVLGKAFGEKNLRQLLLEAVRYGDRPEVRARLTQVVDQALDHEHLRDLLDERALVHDVMDDRKLQRIREDMERNEAKRLQPHFIQSFFMEAFQRLGGTVREREAKRFEIRHVPAVIRSRDRQIGTREVVLPKYERITFEKDLINVVGQPMAEFVCPGHPLLNAVIDLMLERHRQLMRQGAILIDPNDPTEEPRALFYIEHGIRDARTDAAGNWRTISKRLQFVEASPGSAGVPPVHKQWFSRGYLPHFDHPGLVQSITFRLHDAVPESVVDQWKAEIEWMEGLSADDPRAVELRKRMARYEDAGHGECWLRRPEIAVLMQNALLHFDGERYRLLEWSIMPNHVHVLVETREGYSLDQVVHSWKSFTAHEGNKELGRSGNFWMREYFDRFVRDERHLRTVREYIRENPVSAGLCTRAEDWVWSSAGSSSVIEARKDAAGTAALPGFRNAGYAPYLDYRPPTDEERALLADVVAGFGSGSELEQQALGFAVGKLVPGHLEEVKGRNEDRVLKTMAAVKDRLTVEINYWDHRAEELKLQEQAGKVNARLNSGKARQRADELETRLHRRLDELSKERQIAALSPVVTGGALIVPAGLLARLKGERQQAAGLFAHEKKRVEMLGMQAVIKVERELGNEPRDVSSENLGWDIESKDGETGHLRFIEVKGRIASATTVTVTRNEILASFNKPEAYILGIVLVPDSEELGDEDAWQARESRVTYATAGDCEVYYVTEPFDQEPGFGVTSVNYDLKDILSAGIAMGRTT